MTRTSVPTIRRSRVGAPLAALAGLIAAIGFTGTVDASDATAGATVAAATASSATITASAAWARATAPGIGTGAIYLTITNAGDAADELLSATSPAAASVELHQHVHNADGSMAMVAVEKLALGAHGAITCAPGGYHLMLFGLVHPLVAGTRVPLDLVFAHAGTVTTTAVVGGIAAMDFADAAGTATADAGSATSASATASASASGCGCGP